jgi:hypothetical protein
MKCDQASCEGWSVNVEEGHEKVMGESEGEGEN